MSYNATDAAGNVATEVTRTVIAEPMSGEGEGEGEVQLFTHDADQNGDGIVTLSELLRIVQFYNIGGLHCEAAPGNTEDGYVPGANPAAQSCTPHASDYNPQNWVISLEELLRIIQFFNVGGYYACPDAGTEDGYCPGQPPVT